MERVRRRVPLLQRAERERGREILRKRQHALVEERRGVERIRERSPERGERENHFSSAWRTKRSEIHKLIRLSLPPALSGGQRRGWIEAARRRMNRLLLPAQALCLAALHFAFAFSRFVSLLVEFGSRLGLVQPSERWGRRRGDGSGNGERIRDELNRGRWTKTPKHLAINFVRSTPVHVGFGRSTGNRAALEKRELVKLVEDIESVVEWSGEVGIEVLTLYDEYGESEMTWAESAKLRRSFRRVGGNECDTRRGSAVESGWMYRHKDQRTHAGLAIVSNAA